MKEPAATHQEDRLIGCVLKRADLIYPIQAALEPSDFYQPASRAVYAELLALAPDMKSEAIDEGILADRLLAKGKFINSENALRSYLTACMMGAQIEHLDMYVTEIRDKAVLRAMAAAMEKYRTRALALPIPATAEICSEAERELAEIFHRDVRRAHVKVGDIAGATADRMLSGDGTVGVPTGFARLDAITGGLHPQTTTILGARPGMGKTALALNIANNAADKGAKVAIFSLEMTAQALTVRAICSRAKVRSRRGTDAPPYTTEEIERIKEASQAFADLPIYIHDETVNPVTLKASAMRIAREAGGLDLIIVDYLQKMRGVTGKRNENREQEVAGVSIALTNIAKDMRVAMFALAQLSRKCEERNEPRPTLSDLRDSGQIEQDGDLVLLLYRPKFYNPKAKDTAEVIIAKQRDGETGVVNLTFYGPCASFLST